MNDVMEESSFQCIQNPSSDSPPCSDVLLLRHDITRSLTNERMPRTPTESTFGAFGKDPTTLDSHDDSFTMGGEELQIISSHRSSISHDSWTQSDVADYENIIPNSSERNEENDNENENDDDGRDSFSCVSLVNPLTSAASSPSKVHQKQDSFTLEGFDICKEYGYKYEYTLEDDSISSSSSSSSNDSSSDAHCNPLQSQSQGNKTENANSSFISRLRNTPLGAFATSNDVDEKDHHQQSRGLKKNNVMYRTYLLGKTYHPINDYHAKRDDESNLFWFTYRCDFVEIRPYAITSDAGWGCMLRSAQMLLGQVLRMHCKGREWKAERNLRLRREDAFIRSLLTWFADYPFSGSGVGGLGVDSWYSLHNMVAAGCAKYDVLPGEWFGPSTVCYVLRDLVELHQSYLSQGFDDDQYDGEENKNGLFSSGMEVVQRIGQKGKDDVGPLKVYIAPEGTIYNSDICKLLVNNESKSGNNHCMEKTSSMSTWSHKRQDEQDDPKCNHPLLEIPSIGTSQDTTCIEEWNSSLLILIPLRLGLEKFNASSYSVPLAHMLSLPQSVGFLGGSPRHALWFYGADSDGRKVYGLDPHTVQRAPRRRRRKCYNNDNGEQSRHLYHEIVFSNEYLRSINCPNISVMSMKKIDPSLALGFYCRDRQDYESFCSLLRAMKANEKFTGYPELFTFADAKPNYEADVSSAMVEMMATTCQALDGEESDCLLSEHVDEDDEYVML